MARHPTYFLCTLPVGHLRDSLYQQFRHVCGDKPHIVKLQGFVQQIDMGQTIIEMLQEKKICMKKVANDYLTVTNQPETEEAT